MKIIIYLFIIMVNNKMESDPKNIQWFYGDLADFNSLKGVRLMTATNVLPHHFWVGMETDPQQRANGNAPSR